MNCPKCGADGVGEVKDSRIKEDHVYRIRECYSCGCRYRTKEFVSGLVKEGYENRRGKKHGKRSELMLEMWEGVHKRV